MTCRPPITMNSNPMPRNGSATSSRKVSSPPDTSMNGQLSMFGLMTSPATPNATSSRGLADGHTPCASADGQTTYPSGPDLAHASRSPSAGSASGSTIHATCGRSSDASLRSDALQESLESRLRERLTGSVSCEVTWSKWDTPWGQSRWRPRARTRTISGIDIGLWPTATATEARQGYQDRTRGKKGTQESLTTQVVNIALWSTVRASDGEKGGPNMSFGAGGSPLPSQVSTVANTSNAPMENGGGSLHPEFAGWELGYPPEWLSCAPLETPSILARRRSSSAPTSIAGHREAAE